MNPPALADSASRERWSYHSPPLPVERGSAAIPAMDRLLRGIEAGLNGTLLQFRITVGRIERRYNLDANSPQSHRNWLIIQSLSLEQLRSDC